MTRNPFGRLRAIVACAAFALATAVPAATASAAAPDAVGWWHRAVAEPATGVGGVPDAPRPTLVPVPSGGLYVGNDASGPRAVAALRFPLATGSGVLTLKVSGDAFLPMGARLVACPIESTWQPVANGSWESRPQLNCGQATDGTFEEDRSEVRFELPTLDHHWSPRGIEVAVAPADGEVVAFAIAFEAPADEALEVSTDAPTTPAPAGSGAPPPPSGFSPAASPPLTSVPVPPLEEAREVREERASTTQPPAPRGNAGELLSITTDGAGRAALTALIGLLAAAAWLRSGGPPRLGWARLPRLKLNKEIGI